MRGAFPPTPSLVGSARRAAKGREPRSGRLGRGSGTKPGRLRSPAGSASRDGSAGVSVPFPTSQCSSRPTRKRHRPPGTHIRARQCARTPGPQEAPAAGEERPRGGPRPRTRHRPSRARLEKAPVAKAGWGEAVPGPCPLPAARHSSSPAVSLPRGGFRSSQPAPRVPTDPLRGPVRTGSVPRGSREQCPRPRLAARAGCTCNSPPCSRCCRPC